MFRNSIRMYILTKMHSSRMHTVRLLTVVGGIHPLVTHPQLHTPFCPIACWNTPPPHCMLVYTPPAPLHSLIHPLCPIACWDTHPSAPLHAGIHTPLPHYMLGYTPLCPITCWDTPPSCGQTDTCKNITFPQLLLRAVIICGPGVTRE